MNKGKVFGTTRLAAVLALCAFAVCLACACSAGGGSGAAGGGSASGSSGVASGSSAGAAFSASVSASSSSASSDSAVSAASQADGAVGGPAAWGALRVEGAHLVNEGGAPVQLRGASTHGLAWFPAYVNDALFDELRADWNANVVRLAMYTADSGGYCTDGDKEQLRKLVDDGVRYAADNDLYAIVDWHILSDNDPNMHADEAEAFFRDVSAAYADRDNVLYEICNEPNGATTWSDVKRYAERIIPVIRANDPDAVVIVGTPTWCQDVDAAAADPVAFDNVLYALHFYAATHKDDLRTRATKAIEAGLPLFVSEFGICDASGNGAIDEAQADEWIGYLDAHDVGYIMWNLSNKAESSAMFDPACSKASGFQPGDLSQAGAWLKQTLVR